MAGILEGFGTFDFWWSCDEGGTIRVNLICTTDSFPAPSPPSPKCLFSGRNHRGLHRPCALTQRHLRICDGGFLLHPGSKIQKKFCPRYRWSTTSEHHVGAPPPPNPWKAASIRPKPHASFCRDVNGYLTLSWRLISVEPPDQIDFTSPTLTHTHSHTRTFTHALPGLVVKAADTTLLSADSPVHISRSAVRPSHPASPLPPPPPSPPASFPPSALRKVPYKGVGNGTLKKHPVRIQKLDHFS